MAAQLDPVDGDDEVAAREPGVGRRGAGDDVGDEQPGRVGEADSGYGDGSRTTTPRSTRRSTRTLTVPEVRARSAISRACVIAYGGPPRRSAAITRKSAPVRP